MVSFCWKWLRLGLLWGLLPLTGAFAVPPTGQYRSTSLPITIPGLVRGSNRIFVARVEIVDEPTLSRRDFLIRLRIGLSLKGALVSGSSIVVRLAYGLASPLKPGDQVLWFLPEDSLQGYSVPLGYTSGDFRITGADDMAYSQNYNRGLWQDDAELWAYGECSRHQFIDEIYARALGGPTLLKYLRWADSPYSAQPYPLDFLTAAVISCLSTKEYRTYVDRVTIHEDPTSKEG